MALNQQWDGNSPESVALPYDISDKPLSEKPRIVAGQNMQVTLGGKLALRPGQVSYSEFNKRVDKIWTFETSARNTAIPDVIMVASVYNGVDWELWWKTRSGVWALAPALRQSNNSVKAHEAVTARGKLYVKGFPSLASAETLGTVSLSFVSPNLIVSPWGVLGPQTAARLVGEVAKLTADYSATATSIVVDSASGFPAAPFVIQVNYEQMNVTAVAGTTFTVTRGYNDTVAEAQANTSIVLWRNWSSSDHIVTVNQFWEYSYAYVTITDVNVDVYGVTNRSPVETNPDFTGSRTGPFFDQCPKITVQGHADTTHVPFINIYRTTDGGGVPYFLERITNTGAGAITYVDDSLGSGGSGTTFADPIPDSLLDTADIGPGLDTNSPPPSVIAPGVTGTSFPPERNCSNLVYYAGRIWYSLQNYLFGSANEELNSGIPEECFNLGGNGLFFRFNSRIRALQQTRDAIYITTHDAVYRLTGTTLDSFSVAPLSENIGGCPHSRAITRFGENVVFVTADYRVAIINTQGVRIISDPLDNTLITLLEASGSHAVSLDLKYWSFGDKEWIILCFNYLEVPAGGSQYIYDIRRSLKEDRDFWYTPWKLQATAIYSGYTSAESEAARDQNYLIFFQWNGSQGLYTYTDGQSTGQQDSVPPFPTVVPITAYATVSLSKNPTGYHVNQLRRPGMTSVVARFILERTKFVSDTDPTVSYYLDDVWTTPIAAPTPEAPARHDAPKGYKTLEYHLDTACERFAFRVDNDDDLTNKFELQSYSVIWQPESGA